MSIELESNVSISGRALKMHEQFLDAAIFNIQFDTLRLCQKCDINNDMIVSAIDAVRAQWGVGYPGIPQLVVFDTINNSPPVDSRRYFAAGVFLFSDWAISFDQDGKHAEAGRYFHEAEEMYALLRFDTGELLRYFRTELAVKGAKAKLANDPKQLAKAKVKECWDEWQMKPANYKGKSAFAKDMMAKFEELDSQAVITRWCGQWEKEAAR